jgi:endonuclease G
MKTLLTSMLVFISTLVFSQTLPQKIDEDNQIREYNGYIISYNETCEQANWVYYVSKPSDLIGDRTRRRNNFRVDDSIKTVTAELKDYRGSGYDRGHLKPSGDEPTDSTQMSETFYMSNISPQEPSFNRGIWKKLENRVRAIVMESDSVVVITGGVLKEGLKTIGDNKVCVPNH